MKRRKPPEPPVPSEYGKKLLQLARRRPGEDSSLQGEHCSEEIGVEWLDSAEFRAWRPCGCYDRTLTYICTDRCFPVSQIADSEGQQ
ncbi:MAG TPA: hypothetical protein PK093_19465 [Phycisphaerae bacterium]|nr:hypothetical protein [Phycisphaerae bacterium]